MKLGSTSLNDYPSSSFTGDKTWIKELGKRLSLPSAFSHSCLALFREMACFTGDMSVLSMMMIRKNSRQVVVPSSSQRLAMTYRALILLPVQHSIVSPATDTTVRRTIAGKGK